MYKFSIIVPCYNVKAYLEECVESIEAQGLDSYEIILVNDGSTDNTGDIARELQSRYNNIKYFEKTNGGLSDARNYGIDRAQGEYLYFLDSDDMLEKDALRRIYEYIDSLGYPDVIITRYRELDDTNGRLGEEKILPDSLEAELNSVSLSLKDKYRLCYLVNDIKPMASLSVVKREYILKKRLYFRKGLVHEDELWTPQVFLESSSIAFWNRAGYIYRVNRKDSIMNRITEKHIRDRLRIIEEFEKMATDNPEIDAMYISRAACILNGILGMSMGEMSRELRKSIYSKRYILKHSIQKKYMLIYVVLSLLGVKNTMKLEGYLKRR